MAIKEDINEIKQELNAQEHFLESAIKGERFFKKYRYVFAGVFVVAVLAGAYNYIEDYLDNKATMQANALYDKLLANSNDALAKSELKEQAPSLLALIEFKDLYAKNDVASIKALASRSTIDPLLGQIFLASIGDSKEVLTQYNTALDGFELLKQGQISKADAEFDKIPQDSGVQNLIKFLKHYQDIK